MIAAAGTTQRTDHLDHAQQPIRVRGAARLDSGDQRGAAAAAAALGQQPRLLPRPSHGERGKRPVRAVVVAAHRRQGRLEGRQP